MVKLLRFGSCGLLQYTILSVGLEQAVGLSEQRIKTWTYDHSPREIRTHVSSILYISLTVTFEQFHPNSILRFKFKRTSPVVYLIPVYFVRLHRSLGYQSRVRVPVIIRLSAYDYTHCECSVTRSVSPIHINTVERNKSTNSGPTAAFG